MNPAYLIRIKTRERLAKELDECWEAIKKSSYEAAEFVAFRREDMLSWEDISHIAEEMGQDTAIISLFILEDRLVLFALSPHCESPEIVEIDINKKDQQDMWDKFWKEVHQYSIYQSNDTWQQALSPFGKYLFRNKGAFKRVIFVPYGFGHLLPWAVLAHEQDLDLSWVTVPTLLSLIYMWHRPINVADEDLVIGNPKGDLIDAEEEARLIARRLNTIPLIGHDATRENVLKRLSNSRFVHFATHAKFISRDPLDSYIELFDGILKAREIIQLNIHPDLLVLSGCETGMAKSLGGDEIMGIAQAFLQAGARSLLVSLWSVDDPATAELMKSFYKFWLVGGVDKAEALHLAMDKSRHQWNQIYYWGAFIFIGDWR